MAEDTRAAAATEEVTPEVLRLKCQIKNLQIQQLLQQQAALQEAFKRASIEVQVLPARVDEVQKRVKEVQAEAQPMYLQLKSVLGCPEDKEIDLETGSIVERSRQ